LKTQTIRQRLLQSTMIGGTALMALTAVPAVALLMPTAAMAQSQTGALRINVTSGDGAPISGASVTVSSPDSLVSRTGMTDSSGFVRLAGLDPSTNYTVAISAPGFDAFTADNVAVVSGQDRSQGYSLSGGATSLGDVVITGTSLAAVDVTSATVGTTLTLQTVEALPTGRSYQSYLQLVPGTKPGSNPSSRSGVNYSDIGGAIGSSSDNVYYLDGVDVTDPVSGTFGANFNSEIIQEQQVLVGGVPAEYAGGSGLISRVITKSGGNDWHGSVNYYTQNDTLVADDEHGTSAGFSTYDTAFTLGGPILRDRLWFFGSYQKKNRQDDVVNPNTQVLIRSVEQDSEYAFAKLTWQVTDNDRLSVSYFSDPFETTGSNSSGVLNNRDTIRIQGGDNYKVDFSHTWGDLVVNAYWFTHSGEISDFAKDTSVRDTVAFFGPGSTLAQRSQGGAGTNREETRDRDEWGINFEYYLDTGFGTHTFKAGYTSTENSRFEDSTVPGGATYTSIDPTQAGVTFDEFANDAGWTTYPFSNGDIPRIKAAIATSPTAFAQVDTDNSGDLSDDEVLAITFSDTVNGPYGNVGAYRTERAVSGAYTVSSEGQSVYIQDTWTLNQLTVNAGLRAERWEHFASDGSTTATFDWDIAPRMSVVYDVNGDGRSKVFGFVGRYYDPVRNNMSDFAGALTGPVDNEQINVYGEWLTFRVRGGATTPDALFAPTTKTPYTDEYMVGYSTTFGSDIGFSATVTRRETRDILEDFDLALYSDPTNTAHNAPNDHDGDHGYAFPGSPFFLPYEYFGYSSAPNSNYVIGTLPGGERNYTGIELVLTKYKTDNWFGQISYTFNKAEGNTNSDSNADLQGDLLFMDPRAPNVYGDQPGNIPHQFKAYGSYEFDFGLELAAVFNWNSGALYTPAQSVYSRYVPLQDSPYEYWGVTERYFLPGFVGSESHPAYYTFDVRAKYEMDLPIGGVEFFLDVFNVLNNQMPTSETTLISGSGQYLFGEANNWVAPRRAYLGVRYSF
jgi:hypothetical protein